MIFKGVITVSSTLDAFMKRHRLTTLSQGKLLSNNTLAATCAMFQPLMSPKARRILYLHVDLQISSLQWFQVLTNLL